MTENEKAIEYEKIIAESDRIQRLKSILQSENAGISTTSKEYDEQLEVYNRQIEQLEVKMRNLFIN